jgi:hypothetical protein
MGGRRHSRLEKSPKMPISSGKSPIPDLICRTYDGAMKKSTLTPTLICALMVTSACPSFAQSQGNTSGSSSSTTAPQFTAPNYWGDSRVKNRQSAASSQGSGMGQQQQSGGSRGGGGSSMGMFMGPAMMLPMMLMGRGFGRLGRPHYPKQKDDDDQKQSNKHHSKLSSRASMQPSVNDDNSLPDPLYPTQGMSALSRKTLEMQTGNAQSAIEEHKKNVYGNMQDDEGPAPGMSTGTVPGISAETAPGIAPGIIPEASPGTASATAPGMASEKASEAASETAPGTDF